MNVTYSTAGCLDTSYIPPNYPTEGVPIYHDPSGKCYIFSPVTGEPIFYFQYGYNPALVTGIVFTVLFGLMALIHFGLSLTWRPKWYLVVAAGATGEVIGWIGRTLSGVDNSASDAAGNYFLVQIVCLTISPTFFSAACYGLFAVIVNRTEPQISRLSPKILTWLFVIWDIVALVLQATGGAMASLAKTHDQSTRGTNIMVGGIVFQLVAMVVFSIMGLEFFRRLSTPLPKNFQRLASGVAVASFLIILRGAYRSAELSQGWSGFLITHEGYFLGLDAVPMLLCLIVLLAIHPRFTLPLVGPSDSSYEPKEIGTPA